MSSMTESNLEKKFQHVSNTQDSIQSFSLWIIHHKSHCKKIVDVWMKILRKTKVTHRLTLLYLANDVIQNAKRKGAAQFAEIFFSVLPEATVLLRDDKIRMSVERVFNIWENRSIYTSEAVEELKRILNNAEETNNATSKVISEFKPELLTEKIRKDLKLQLETTSKLSALNASKLDAANSEVLRQFKDRSHGQQFSRDFEEATRCLEEYIGALQREVAERAETIQLLEQAVIYYDTQRGEARIVANAYKSFSNRITVQKKKLEGLKALLPSPFPSPCADAPSPSNSEEGLDLVPGATAAPATLLTDDVPSPVGTPEGLQLSPKDINAVSEMSVTTDDLKLTPPVISSNPSIPVASFLGTQGAGLMSSWLDAFNTPVQSGSADPKLSVTNNKSEDTLDSRLDSRLLNLMQSMPSSVPSALLAGVGGETPVKDEWASTQGTPVQDEDEPPQNDLLKYLNRYSSNNVNSPSQSQWPSALPPNNTSVDVPFSSVKESSPEIKPLLPPPKPSFACLGLLSNMPVGNTSSASPVHKGKSDPRLASQNYTAANASTATTNAINATNTHTGTDDNEPMDMEIGESDDDEEKAKLESEVKINDTIDVLLSNNHMSKIDSLFNDKQGDDVKKDDFRLSDVSKAIEKPTSYSTYRHYTYKSIPDSRPHDNNLNDDQVSENRLQDNMKVEDGRPEIGTNDNKMSDSLLTENRRTDISAAEEKNLAEDRLTDSAIPNSQLSENRLPDSKSADSVTIESTILESRIADNRTTDMMVDRNSDGRPDVTGINENRMPDGNKSGNMWKVDEMECSRIETIQTVRNDDWRPPVWDDGPPSGYDYRPPPHPHYRPHQEYYGDRRPPYDRSFEPGYRRNFAPPMMGGPKRFPAPFGGRGGRGRDYFVPRF